MISELLPGPVDAGQTTSTPSGMSTSTPRRLWLSAPRISIAPIGSRTADFSAARSPSASGERAALPEPFHGALEYDRASAGAGAWPEVDHWSAIDDRLRLVLDHQDRVALVAQAQQQVVHALDVVRVQADRRLVEDVGDVGERRSEVPDHLRALGLAAGERARRAVEPEVAEADLDEGVERLLQRVEQRRDRGLRVRAPTRPGR